MKTSNTLVPRAGLLLFLSLCAVSPATAAGPGADNDFAGKRVLYIGLDGVRPDTLATAKTPHIDALIKSGIIANHAIAGGHLGKKSQQETSSGPGWASLLTGVWADKHMVKSNKFKNTNLQKYPHFFRRIHELHPDASLSSIVHWKPIDTHIVEASKSDGEEFLDFRKVAKSDKEVALLAVQHLTKADPDAMFLHFDDVDHAGHAHGYGPDIPAYASSIETVDQLVGSVVSAVKARPQYDKEDWVIIVTTDHGGIRKGHGGQTKEERRIFIIVSGGTAPEGVASQATPGQPAIPSTVMQHLGIKIDPAWGWEEKAFGLHAPAATPQTAPPNQD